ncbi:MAG TPA: hypothetical protein VLF67_05005, partial [Candidatus Saccharimonas sp.]|nr:hypothetical protein [Candidatus Saccharimonas sp.]
TPSVQGAADQAERLNQERKPAEGLALIKSVQWKAWTKGDKLIVLSQLAGTSLALDRDADAIKYYRQMEALQGTTLANDLNLAEIGEKIGDKDLAIKEYQQAIVDLKKLPESDIQQITPEGLQEHIDALQHPEAQP